MKLTTRLRIIQQSLTLSDTSLQTAISALLKTISESLSFTDGDYSKAKGKMKSITNSLALASTAVKSRPFMVKLVSHTVTLAHDTSRTRLVLLRFINQNLTFSSNAIRSVKSAIKQFRMKISRFKKLRYN